MTMTLEPPTLKTADDQMAADMEDRSICSLGKPWNALLPQEQLHVVCLVVRDRAMKASVETEKRYADRQVKRAYYISLECLIGRLLASNLLNLGIQEECRDAVSSLGTDLDQLLELEADAGLGNGGLGRLAACLLDSMATMHLPGFGYCLNYNYGLFRQAIIDGRQVEQTDNWMRHGTPWEVEHTEECIEVPLRGRVVVEDHGDGSYRPRWVDTDVILGRPFGVPIVGYGGTTVNHLRLFSAHAAKDFDMDLFDEGHFVQAVHNRDLVETITKVLYPNDEVAHGPELRLVQEYFLVACSLGDILRNLGPTFDMHELADRVAIHLNDTHPALAVPELMRQLVDKHDMPWEQAWKITTQTLAFTNHTLMPEALERWPASLMEELLPRHLQIIIEINRRLLLEVAAKYPGDVERIRRMSLFEEGDVKKVRMALLAIVGSHAVNGVAKMHSELIKTRLVPDFYQLTPSKFGNKTNGVTPRRWLLQCNPDLSSLITEAIGEGWITDLTHLRELEPYANDSSFRDHFNIVKHKNKQRLAHDLNPLLKIQLDAATFFDVQIKRIHEYKRQLLHLLYVVHQYQQIIGGQGTGVPRTHIFSGKAAPGYQIAKEVIYLINRVAETIDDDSRCRGLLRVVFVPDYRVTVAEAIIPAADLGEQISTAGTEASGTSNMKLAMNGALTIGTLDGANVEICDAVGAENIFIFGNHAAQLDDLRERGVRPRHFYEQSTNVRRIMDAFKSNILSPGNAVEFNWVFQRLVDSWDPYFHLADLDSYINAQQEAEALYRNPQMWIKTAILNVARIGWFSSDRTAREYARDTWNIAPCI